MVAGDNIDIFLRARNVTVHYDVMTISDHEHYLEHVVGDTRGKNTRNVPDIMISNVFILFF